MPSYPLVEVYILAYNHERFIARCLESVLTQDTTFPFHITILEDCSTDGTREIVRRFAEAHPDLIDLHLHERNLCSNGPFVSALAASRAGYVALLDGDDYWTSPGKLRRQVDFLEAHPECALSFHRVEMVDEAGRRSSVSPRHPAPISTISDLFVDNFLYTPSVLYRRSALAAIPDWFHEIRAADRNLHLLAARWGRIGYVDEVMAAWRVHRGGLWSGLSPVDQGRWAVQSQTELLEHFPAFHHPDIRTGLVNRFAELALAQLAEGDGAGATATVERVRRLSPARAMHLQRAIRERTTVGTRSAAVATDVRVAERARAGNARIEASVIVPCRDPGPELRILLNRLEEQDASFPWELLVVDNGTTDASLQALAEFEGRLPLRLVQEPTRPGQAYANNLGAQRASSDKLLFIDADDEVAPNYVRRLVEALDDHELVASRVDSVTLNQLPIHQALDLRHWQETGVDTFFDFLPATGCYIGIRRETFLSLGGFPTEFPRAVDIAFAWRAQLSGLPIHFVPDTTYFYRHRRSVRALYRQHRKWGTVHPLLYKRFREAGMPGRSMRQLRRELGHLLSDLLRARSKVDLEKLLVRTATYVGRVQGSVRHRTLYV